MNKKYLTFDDVLLRPVWSDKKSRMGDDISTAGRASKNVEISIPIMSANMRTVTDANMCNAMAKAGGIGILHRYFNDNLYDWFSEIGKITELYGMSVGYEKWSGVLTELFEPTADWVEQLRLPAIVVYDVANAANEHIFQDVQKLIKYRDDIETLRNYRFDIIVGNIATAEAAFRYKELNIEGLKVGIGPGSACTTRLMTGCGVPQLTAIQEVFAVLNGTEITLIADGGIEKSGDMCKALAAGADCVMMGKQLAYAKESPGWYYDEKTRWYLKDYKGEASFAVNRVPEGKALGLRLSHEPHVVQHITTEYGGSLRSCLSYCNAYGLRDLKTNANIIEVSTNTLIENHVRN